MEIHELKKLYSGFYIDSPTGNNIFSFGKRRNKKIFVPPLFSGKINDILIGNEIVFSEIDDGIEFNKVGLKHFVHMTRNGKQIFVFDNHNHAFCFWLFAYKNNIIKKGSTLVHIDQHTDMRDPVQTFSDFNNGKFLMKDVFYYTNYILNVGDFIKPAQEIGMFSKVHILNSLDKFKQKFSDEIILDIDIDLFVDGMSHFSDDIKFEKIREYAKYSKIITIATSPFFIEQEKAINIVKKIISLI